MPTWLQIGLVGKAHGLRGHFFVSQRDDPLPIPLGTDIYLGRPPKRAPHKLQTSKMQGRRPLAKLEGIDSREAVEEIVGEEIWVDRALLDEAEGDEYYWGDLVGKSVVDPNGERLGLVTDIGNYGASDIVTIEAQGGRILELPLVETYFDMSFRSDDPDLRLVVEGSLFEELWHD